MLASVASIYPLAQVEAQVPRGGQVVAGNAAIATAGNRTTIHQTSDRAIIDWRGFDVGADHHVDFAQPGAHAATLNRITEGGPSTIDGRISAPGSVIIQNQAGVLFSGSARVDVGSLVATSQIVDAAAFEAGRDLAIGGGERPGAEVVNRGSVTVAEAGLVALVGSEVANHGTLVARKGTVALASGERTTIDLAGDGLARVVVEGDGPGHVVNTGTIDAAGGYVLLSAGEAARTLDGAINTSGVIRAADAEASGGTIELVGRGSGEVRLAGTLEASGAADGGAVTVTGETVRLDSTARIDARGTDQGGTVRIGGNRLGAPPLRRAQAVTMVAGAAIDARGEAGGSVVLWADETTVVDGRIDASGVTQGGFVETSGQVNLAVGETASVNAGSGGQWLLDPRDVIIRNPGGGSAGDFVPPAGGTPYRINGRALETALDAGTDVTISTEQPASTMAGDITVNTRLRWTGDGSLTLRADQDVFLNQAVESRGTGSFTVDAARHVLVDAGIEATGSGDIALLARTGDLIATQANNSRNIVVSTAMGDLRLEAPEGSVLLRRETFAGARNLRIFSRSGDLDVVAGTRIEVLGRTNTSWVRVGDYGGTGAVRLTAPEIAIQGGTGANTFAEVVGGAGSSIALTARERITIEAGSRSRAQVGASTATAVRLEAPRIDVRGSAGTGAASVQSGAGGSIEVAATERLRVRSTALSEARIAAVDGATLTLDAPEQEWDGPIVGSGTVVLGGAIEASVQPGFELEEGADFHLRPTSRDGTASGFEASVPLGVLTRGTGTIDADAPIEARAVSLISEERVRLGVNAHILADDDRDAIVIAAGRTFDNRAGSDVLELDDPTARWLVYVDTFDGMVGAEPSPRAFDLYGRPFATTPPASLAGLPGNRLVYGEQPTVTVAADALRKTYGEAVTPTVSVTGVRPADSEAAVLGGTPGAVSGGAAADADAGSYPIMVTAALSDQGTIQGYLLRRVDDTLTIDRANLTVTTNDASRARGQADPTFSVTYNGFVLGQDPGVLDGTLGFTAPPADADAGTYPVTPDGLTSGNYAITFAPGTLDVTPAPLTVTA
ncbi:MAG: MBG domain-containing protein, partial [Pseudomonadota bacterium]